MASQGSQSEPLRRVRAACKAASFFPRACVSYNTAGDCPPPLRMFVAAAACCQGTSPCVIQLYHASLSRYGPISEIPRQDNQRNIQNSDDRSDNKEDPGVFEILLLLFHSIGLVDLQHEYQAEYSEKQ